MIVNNFIASGILIPMLIAPVILLLASGSLSMSTLSVTNAFAVVNACNGGANGGCSTGDTSGTGSGTGDTSGTGSGTGDTSGTGSGTGTTPPDTTGGGHSKHHHHSSGSGSTGIGTLTLTGDSKHSSGLRQIPSNKTDFPNNDASVIQVHISSAKKDILGDYEIKGELTNVGNDTLQFVHIMGHVYDATGQLVGNGDGYTTPSDLDSQHTGTFDMFITKDTLSGTPSSYRLSYDWS